MKKIFTLLGGMLFADTRNRSIIYNGIMEVLDTLTDTCILSSDILEKYLDYREHLLCQRKQHKNYY